MWYLSHSSLHCHQVKQFNVSSVKWKTNSGKSIIISIKPVVTRSPVYPWEPSFLWNCVTVIKFSYFFPNSKLSNGCQISHRTSICSIIPVFLALACVISAECSQGPVWTWLSPGPPGSAFCRLSCRTFTLPTVPLETSSPEALIGGKVPFLL